MITPSGRGRLSGLGAVTAVSLTTSGAITATGAVTASGYTATTEGTAGAPAYGFSSAAGLGMFALGSANKVYLTANSAARLEVASASVEAISQSRLGVSGPLALDFFVTTALTGNQNDWAPTNGASATVWRVTPDAARNVTGLSVSQEDGRVIIIENCATTAGRNIVLIEQATSTAANQFITPGAANVTITVGAKGICIYDATAQRWRASLWA